MYNLKLKDIRKEKGLTQEELANAVGVSTRVLGAWERCDTEFPFNYAVEIADMLGCSLEELAGRPKPSVTVSKEKFEDMLNTLGVEVS